MSKSRRLLEIKTVVVSLLLFSAPGTLGQTSNIQVSNFSSSSATISWTTTDSTVGCVHYGLTSSLGDTTCDPRPDDDVHFVQITELAPDTIYYFEVASGGEIDSNGGDYYTFTTAQIGVGVPYTTYGLVYLSDSTTAAEGVIFSAVVKSGTSTSHPLATLTNSSGIWSLNLGNLKDPASNGVFAYSTGDSIFVAVQGAADGEYQGTEIISGESPQRCDTMILGFRGDANGDGGVGPGDVVYLLNYLYRGGDPPDPLWIGDANSDGVVGPGDVVYLLNYLYRGGPPPM